MTKLMEKEMRKFIPSLGNNLRYSVSWFSFASISRRRAISFASEVTEESCDFNSASSASAHAILALTTMRKIVLD